jgi:hypothetical protein
MLFDIVWDDRHCDEARLRAALRLVGPQAAYIWQNGLAPFRYLAERFRETVSLSGKTAWRRFANKFPGGHRGRVTPVPIPNTEVKPATADGTACEGAWESRSLPGVI